MDASQSCARAQKMRRFALAAVTIPALLSLAATTAPAATLSAAAQSTEAAKVGVRSTLARYQAAIERLDGGSAADCFSQDAQIFESGGAEGSYADYLAHHLAPELASFRSFSFSNYMVSVQVEGHIALATETYNYKIVTKTGETVERQGVATSALKKTGARWLIVSLHSSGRKPKAN